MTNNSPATLPVSFRVLGMSEHLTPVINQIRAFGYHDVLASILPPGQLPSPTDDDRMLIILADGCNDTATTIARSFYQAGILTLVISTVPFTGETSFCDAQSVTDLSSMPHCVKGILDMPIKSGYIRLDFNDLAHSLRNAGYFKIIGAVGSGEKARVADALSKIGNQLSGEEKTSADNIITYLSFSSEMNPPLHISEMEPLAEYISDLPEKIDAIWGLLIDNTIPTNQLHLTAILSGKSLKPCVEKGMM